jgi:pyruvate kinase
MAQPAGLSAGERVAYVKTKIIATVGPATESAEALRSLVLAGVDIFRLNFAHGQHDRLAEIVNRIRQISLELRRSVGILGDLSGPKIRLGEIAGGSLDCVSGARVEFTRQPDVNHPERLASTYESLVDELHVGDAILLADGAVTLRVTERIAAEGRIVCEVEQPGSIRSRQGINLPGVSLSTPSLTDKDRDDLAWALEQQLDFVGLSFVRSAADIHLLREAIDAHTPASTNPPLIVAKIEKMEAISQLEEILDATDAIMVARGDLGVEVDLALVPGLQKRIIRLCNEHRIPVITATQMLESMTEHNRPTRAEATDVANAVLDGSDAVMLSGETAVGKFPLEAVTAMSRIAREAERLMPTHKALDPQSAERQRALAITEAVTLGAGTVAEQLEANLIVVATQGGKTALAMSRQRNRVPIIGLSENAATCRRLTLYWGVTPLNLPATERSPEQLLRFIVDWGRKQQILQTGSRIVLVTGSNWSGAHDVLQVHTVP